jgi:hypothetical protein
MRPTLGTPTGHRPGNRAGNRAGWTAVALACLVLGLTAGCGSSSSYADPGQGPASDPAGAPSRSAGSVDGATVLPLISMTGAGGRPQRTATELDSLADLKAFSRQFRAPGIWRRIQAETGGAIGDPDRRVVGQIVMVGCDRPPGVGVVVDEEGRVVLVPQEVASPLPECLAPVTTVAIAILPSG